MEALAKKVVETYRAQVWDRAELGDIAEAFVGHFKWESEVREYLLQLWWDNAEVPEHLISYIDEDRVYRDMKMDYTILRTDIGEHLIFHTV